MASIQAFHAIRYDLAHVGNLSDVVAPPYDVIDADMQRDLYLRHPANVVRLILNRPEPGDSPGAHYKRAGEFLKTWLKQGVLKQDKRPSLYVYHQQFELGGQSVVRRSFIGRVRLEEFGSGRIYPHEQTHSKAKEDRLNLTRATSANLSQIFGIYDDPDNQAQRLLEAAIEDNTPVQAVDGNGVVHQMWSVTDPAAIAQLAALMGTKALYIADGHHRYETALKYRSEQSAENPLPEDHPANYVSMCCVSMGDPGMIVLPTHRLWRGVDPIDSNQLIDKLGDAFACQTTGSGPQQASSLWEKIAVEDVQGQLAFYCAQDDRWVMARLTTAGEQMLRDEVPDQSDDWRGLGVSILHRLAARRLLGISGGPSPKYVHTVEEVIQGLKEGDQAGRDATGQVGLAGRFELATLVMPATIEHVRRISEHGERMPAKSTYFYPKLLSGLIINPLTL